MRWNERQSIDPHLQVFRLGVRVCSGVVYGAVRLCVCTVIDGVHTYSVSRYT